MKKIAIIDYGSGNLRSVQKAFESAGSSRADIIISNSPKDIEEATHLVLPGVGAFADCMAGINAVPGLRDVLEREVVSRKKRLFGICVGMQVLAKVGHEHGDHEGLGWIDAEVYPLEKTSDDIKVPHMGWNSIKITQRDNQVISSLEDGEDLYFVHSYQMKPKDFSVIAATTEYGQEIVAAIAKDNIIATQFHPEKSQNTGLKLIRAFINWSL